MIAAALLVLAIVATRFFSRFLQSPRHEPTSAHATPVRFTLTLPDDAEMADGAQFAVSADGTQIVVAARRAGGPQRLWIRRLQSLEWREMPGTDGATFPFWSPDSRHVGFFADRRLKRIDVANSLTQTICDAGSGQGGTWGTQDVIVFADDMGLSRVPASGGAPVPVTKVDGSHGQRAHLWPHFLPDGRRFVFQVQKANDEAATAVGQIDAAGSVSDRGRPWTDGLRRGRAAVLTRRNARHATVRSQRRRDDWRGGDTRRRRRDRGQYDGRIRVLRVEHGPRLPAWRGTETAIDVVRPGRPPRRCRWRRPTSTRALRCRQMGEEWRSLVAVTRRHRASG